MRVVILRGLPGAGKSHYAKQRWALPDGSWGATYCSADSYFVGPDGVYRWDAKLLGAAHAACLRKYTEAIVSGTDPWVVVDNTNTRLWECAPYHSLAVAFDREVEIVEVRAASPEIAQRRDIHQVGVEAHQNMALRFEPAPNNWRCRVVVSG